MTAKSLLERSFCADQEADWMLNKKALMRLLRLVNITLASIVKKG